MSVRSAEEDDLPSIAAVHSAAFPNHFLTSLGPQFLQLYYCGVLEHSKGILLVAQDIDDEIVGFAAGFGNVKEFYATQRKRRLRTIRALLSVLLRSPKKVHMIRTRLRHSDRVVRGAADACLIELASIGVHPNRERRGTGRELLSAFELAAGALGARGMYLWTDANDNAGVLAFYARAGWVKGEHVSAPSHRIMVRLDREV